MRIKRLLNIQILFCSYSYNLWRFTDLIIRFSNGQNLENVQRKLFEIRSKQRTSLDDHLGVEPVTRACHCLYTGVCYITDQFLSFQQLYTGVSSKSHGRAYGTTRACLLYHTGVCMAQIKQFSPVGCNGRGYDFTRALHLVKSE